MTKEQIEFNIEANRILIIRLDMIRVMMQLQVSEFTKIIKVSNSAIHAWRTGLTGVRAASYLSIEKKLGLPNGTLSKKDVRFSVRDDIKIYFGEKLVKIILTH